MLKWTYWLYGRTDGRTNPNFRKTSFLKKNLACSSPLISTLICSLMDPETELLSDLFSRWYHTSISPDRVRTWISKKWEILIEFRRFYSEKIAASPTLKVGHKFIFLIKRCFDACFRLGFVRRALQGKYLVGMGPRVIRAPCRGWKSEKSLLSWE